MAIQNASDSQKVDYLWKKIAYGATKTDIAGNIDATQEPFPSPLQIRADKILQDSASIPGVIPGANTSIVTVYTTSLPIECTSDSGIATPTLTWTTGRNFWIPPEFGSTYQVKVYISPSGQAGNVATKGTQVFATGSGNNDLWVFDYQSGILNFNSNNTPYNGASPISFTGNSVYISGAVYAGKFGLPTNANIANVILGNVTFSNTTISTSITSANLILSPTGIGAVQISGTGAMGIPYGTTAQRPSTVAVGYLRFNTDLGEIESWDGSGWVTPGTSVITSDIINPDGTSNVYTLSSNSVATGLMVSINGTLQQPYTAYTIVNNNQIQFTETPLTSDIIDVRHIASSATAISYLQAGATSIVLDGVSNVNVTGNLVISGGIYAQSGVSFLTANPAYYTGKAQNITINATLIDSVRASGNSLVRWTLTSTDNASNFKSSTIDALNDGGNVYFSEYAEILSNANVAVSNFVSNIGSGNINLWAIGTNSNITVSFQRTILGSTTLTGYQTAGPQGIQGATGPAGTIGNTSSVIQTTSTTASNTTTNGALIVYGGAGIAGNLNVGGPVNKFAGDILPAANVTYSLGSSALQWKDLWISGNTIYLGNQPLTISSGQLALNGNIVGASDPFGNINVAAYTQTMAFSNYSNVNVKAYTESMGFKNYSNVNTAAYVATTITNNQLSNYSNVNVQAYTESMGFQNYSNVNTAAYVATTITNNQLSNYSNVNVAAYTRTMGYTNYSNVNVAAVITTNGLTNYSNVNVAAYILSYSGNVGGTLSTTSQPYITTLSNITAGYTQITSLGVGTGTFGNVGEIRATNAVVSYYSDERLKTKLGVIENALDKVDQLTGFYYEANDTAQILGYTRQREVGVSAQATQEVLPEIVRSAPISDEYLTVQYERFAPLLIEAIKELRQEVNEIKRQLKGE